MLSGVAVDVEHRPVARQPTGGNAEIEPPLCDVVEHRDPVRELRRVMVRQQEPAGSEADVAGLHQRLRDQQIWRWMWLPWRGVMFADPGLAEAELIGPAQRPQIPLMPVDERAFGRMRR